jgi:hypothetical protein
MRRRLTTTAPVEAITLLNRTYRRSISFRIFEKIEDEVEGLFSGTHKVRLFAPVEIAADIDLSMTTCWLLMPMGGQPVWLWLPAN